MSQSTPTTEDLVSTAPAPRASEEDHGAEQAVAAPDEAIALLDDEQADAFLDRWRDVQSRFVDDPQGAVRDGDSLVAELMQSLAERFSAHKRALELQWQQGDEPETEDLRVALQRYRSFFQRLLTT